jgi:uncharacterized protein (TIGR02266 family)
MVWQLTKAKLTEQFIERYAVDVSQGGIFIRTKEPLAVGTQMKFAFQLRDASPLIAGEGTVVWTRENDPSRPAIAPGMGIRFDRLGDGSQHILERILAEKVKQAPQRPVERPRFREADDDDQFRVERPRFREADDDDQFRVERPRFREADDDHNPFAIAIGTRQSDFLPEQEPESDDKDAIWLTDAGALSEQEPEGDDDVMWLAVADTWSCSLDELKALKSDLAYLNLTLEPRAGE